MSGRAGITATVKADSSDSDSDSSSEDDSDSESESDTDSDKEEEEKAIKKEVEVKAVKKAGKCGTSSIHRPAAVALRQQGAAGSGVRLKGGMMLT